MRIQLTLAALLACGVNGWANADNIIDNNGKCNLSRYLTVKTSNGLIHGHQAPGTNCVGEYLGIPYAKPPVGNLRFAAPRKIDTKKNHEAARFGYDCVLPTSKPVNYPNMTAQASRILDFFTASAGTEQSEDCLTLNIWSRPTLSCEGGKKPVIVYFYGGRFTLGNTNSPFYNGKYFAEAEDVIVVTVNYRLNIFGFPGAPGGPQNLGLRDQRAAVEWIRDNIHNFGGSRTKITIAGQSSGGVGVDYWSYAYRRDPIANGIIAPSGNAFSFPLNAPDVPEKNWNIAVAAVGCKDAEDVMACMRKVPWQDLKAAAGSVKPVRSSSVLRSIPAFYPVADGELVFADYAKLTAEGKFAGLPVLMGNNHNEDGYYRIPAFANGVVPTDEQVRTFLLESFTCPASLQAAARRAHGVPAWVYRYMADWDNTRLFPTSGAYHGVDMHMIFGASRDVSGLPTSADQRKMTALMQRAWSSFSDDPWAGLTTRLGWPRFDRAAKTLAVLGEGNRPRLKLTRPSEYDEACSTVTLGALATKAPTTP